MTDAGAALNVAVVGLGIGTVHIEEGYLPNAERFRLGAICALDHDRLDELGDRFGIGHRTTDFDALLDRDDIDVIDICTPPYLHFEQSLKALRAGKHVICEKPVCATRAEIAELADAERAGPGRIMPVFQYRFGNGIEQVRAVLASGLAGKPYVATAETLWKRTPEYYAVPWRGHPATELGGVLISQAIHIHDLATLLMGPVERVFARVATRVNDIEVEDCVTANCLLASGALMNLTATLGSQEEISRIRLAFEHLAIESDHAPYCPGRAAWRIVPGTDAVSRDLADILADWEDRPHGFAAQFARFHAAIRSGGPLPVTLADARRALDLIEAILASERTNADQTLPPEPLRSDARR